MVDIRLSRPLTPRPAGGSPRGPAPRASTPQWLLGAALIIAGLSFGRPILVPLAIAIFLAFILTPLVLFLRRWHFGRVPSVLAAVLLAVLVIVGLGVLVTSQIGILAADLPRYEYTIRDKIQTIRGSALNNQVVERAAALLKSLRQEIADGEGTTAASGQSGGTPEAKPVKVEMTQPPLGSLEVIQNVVAPLLEPLATIGVVIIFLAVILLQREDLRDRFIRLVGTGDLQRTTRAVDDAGQRLSRYLLIQSGLNATFGIVIGIGLAIIGVPNPALWGIMAMLLRFVPYIGPIIAAVFPTVLALAISPSWSMVFWTVGLFLVTEPIIGQVVEPWIYGRQTGLSPLAVVVSAAFWTWAWGPLGLIVSTPLTLCLVVIGRHVESLHFLSVALGDQPALTPEESFYQRMLAGDPHELADQAEQFLKSKPLSAYYDQIAVPGLALAQHDFKRGSLDDEHLAVVEATVVDLVDYFSDRPETADAASPGETGAKAREGAVLSTGGRSPLDEAAAAMLAQLLTRQGLAARFLPSSGVSGPSIPYLDANAVETVCLSYLDPTDLKHARYVIGRLRRRLPEARIAVGLWGAGSEAGSEAEILKSSGADSVFFTLADAVRTIVDATPVTRVPAPLSA